MDTLPADSLSLRPPPAGARAVLEASAAAMRRGEAAGLALVVETEGSTYVHRSAVALFGGADGQVGWLSGGCLEPEIERLAISAAQHARIEWLDIDTRDDEDLLSGSAVGCRGRLHIALLPLQLLSGWSGLIASWREGAGALRITVDANGTVACDVGGRALRWSLPTSPPPARGAEAGKAAWQVDIAPPPAVLVLGAGPETPVLLPLLRSLGWMTTVVEQRPRWRPLGTHADATWQRSPSVALAALRSRAFDAALVMHHNFELDREALAALATSGIGFIGLLGPVRRREDLFRVLPADVREALQPRLHSPVGLHLGGQGPEAIALSVAAQLHAHRHLP